MSGQAIVVINEKEWSMKVATLPWELAQGLGGISEIPLSTGMLFDLGSEQIIEVTTVPMLFPLDIAFLSDDQVITEVVKNVEQGLLLTSTFPARYFLEVNAGELDNVVPGNDVVIEYFPLEEPMVTPNWISSMTGMAGLFIMGIFAMRIAQESVNEPGEELEKTGSISQQASPKLIRHEKRKTTGKNELEFLPDSPEFLAYTIDDIGYREKIDAAFLSAIARARSEHV